MSCERSSPGEAVSRSDHGGFVVDPPPARPRCAPWSAAPRTGWPDESSVCTAYTTPPHRSASSNPMWPGCGSTGRSLPMATGTSRHRSRSPRLRGSPSPSAPSRSAPDMRACGPSRSATSPRSGTVSTPPGCWSPRCATRAGVTRRRGRRARRGCRPSTRRRTRSSARPKSSRTSLRPTTSSGGSPTN